MGDTETTDNISETSESGTSYTWLWVLLVIVGLVVIGVVVYFVFFRNKNDPGLTGDKTGWRAKVDTGCYSIDNNVYFVARDNSVCRVLGTAGGATGGLYPTLCSAGASTNQTLATVTNNRGFTDTTLPACTAAVGPTGSNNNRGSTGLSPLIQGCYTFGGTEYYVKPNGTPCIIGSSVRSALCPGRTNIAVPRVEMLGPLAGVTGCVGNEVAPQNISILNPNMSPTTALASIIGTNPDPAFLNPATTATCNNYSWEYTGPGSNGYLKNNVSAPGITGATGSNRYLQFSSTTTTGTAGTTGTTYNLTVGPAPSDWVFIPSSSSTYENPIGRICSSDLPDICLYGNTGGAFLAGITGSNVSNILFDMIAKPFPLSATTTPVCIAPPPPPVTPVVIVTNTGDTTGWRTSVDIGCYNVAGAVYLVASDRSVCHIRGGEGSLADSLCPNGSISGVSLVTLTNNRDFNNPTLPACTRAVL